MKHNKVYVRIAEDDNFGTASIEPRPFTEAYIRKGALLEWAVAKKSELFDGEPTDVAAGINAGLDMIIKKLKSL